VFMLAKASYFVFVFCVSGACIIFMRLCLVVTTSEIDFLERLVSEMMYYVKLYSLTQLTLFVDFTFWPLPIWRRHLFCKCCFFRIDSVNASERIFTKLQHMMCIGRQ